MNNKKTEAQRTILLSAGRLIAERGYANVSMRDIAKEANVSLGLLTADQQEVPDLYRLWDEL